MYSSFKLIRFVVAYVFITSGFMKLTSPELASAFLKLGLPYSHLLINVVIVFEIVCGIFILFNKGVQNAVIPLIVIMIAAIILTKVPTLQAGLLSFAFNARLDFVMLTLLIILYNHGVRHR